MKYTDFSQEQIMNENYTKICNYLLALSNNTETTEKLQSILYQGGYLNYGLASNIVNRDNPYIERRRRISMAYLIIRNPETFNCLVNNNINLFHGTSFNALPNILKYGVCSLAESKRIGNEVTTGERWSSFGKDRDFVSFTDVLDIAEGYSTINSDSNNYSFPIILGITKEDAKNAGTVVISSDVVEVGINNRLPKEYIKTIMVPSNKVDIVKRIVDNGIEVLAIDDVANKFYSIGSYGSIYIHDDKYNDLRTGLTINDYKMTGIKETVLSRSLSHIKNLMDKFGSLIEGDDYNVEHRHTK